MVNPILARLDGNFDEIAEGNLKLRDAFFSPWRLVQEGGIDPVLRGLIGAASKLVSPVQVSYVKRFWPPYIISSNDNQPMSRDTKFKNSFTTF